jgi:hypothetical protein
MRRTETVTDWTAILNEFRNRLRAHGQSHGFTVRQPESPMFVLEGSVSHLLYVKVRSEDPLRWGVTANRVKQLETRKNARE